MSTARFATGQWPWGAAAAMTESRPPPPHCQLVLGGPPHPPRSLQVTTALHTTSFQSVLKQNATQKNTLSHGSVLRFVTFMFCVYLSDWSIVFK